MTPPHICPPSPSHPEDCPLYAQRLDYGTDEPLRRAILMERSRPSLAELVWADFNRAYQRPESPPTRPPAPRPALPKAQVQPSIFALVNQEGERP